jgi:hypothetical protein
MVAGMLQRLGVHMDATIGAPDALAPKGYFESAEAHRINSEVFELAWEGRVGFSLDPHFTPPPHERILAQRDRVRADIERFVARFATRPLWGFKNPKTSLTFELYRPLLPNPHLVVTRRPPMENARAIHRVYGLPLDRSLEITTHYQSILARTCREGGCPYLIVDFERARNETARAAVEIATFLNIDLDRDKLDAVEDVVVTPSG